MATECTLDLTVCPEGASRYDPWVDAPEAGISIECIVPAPRAYVRPVGRHEQRWSFNLGSYKFSWWLCYTVGLFVSNSTRGFFTVPAGLTPPVSNPVVPDELSPLEEPLFPSFLDPGQLESGNRTACGPPHQIPALVYLVQSRGISDNHAASIDRLALMSSVLDNPGILMQTTPGFTARTVLAAGLGAGAFYRNSSLLALSEPRTSHDDSLSGESSLNWHRGIMSLEWRLVSRDPVRNKATTTPFRRPPLPVGSLDCFLCIDCIPAGALYFTSAPEALQDFFYLAQYMLRLHGMLVIRSSQWIPHLSHSVGNFGFRLISSLSSPQSVYTVVLQKIADRTGLALAVCSREETVGRVLQPRCIEPAADHLAPEGEIIAAQSPWPSRRWNVSVLELHSDRWERAAAPLFVDSINTEARARWQAKIPLLAQLFGERWWRAALLNVLDLGCEDGGALAAALDEFHNPEWSVICAGLNGVDEPLVKAAMLRGYMAIENGFPATAFPFPSRVFDVVYISAVFLVLHPARDIPRLVMEIQRVLRPHGSRVILKRPVPADKLVLQSDFQCSAKVMNWTLDTSVGGTTHYVFEN